MASLQDFGKSINFDDSVLSYVISNEGFESKPYKDSKGILTVGHGLNMEDPVTRSFIPNDVLEGKRPIEFNESVEAVKRRLGVAKKDVNAWLGDEVVQDLNENQKKAMIDFLYNVGLDTASDFDETKKYLVNKDYEKAAIEFLDSDYAKQVGDRAIKNSNLIRNNEFNKPKLTDFQQAFKQAREAGKKVFNYNGNNYTTEIKK